MYPGFQAKPAQRPDVPHDPAHLHACSRGLPSSPVQVHTVVTGGMPGWQIALIAIGAALTATIVAVRLGLALTARKLRTAAA